MSPRSPLTTRQPTRADLDVLVALEARSYPPDEAASHETFAYRLDHAAECWLLGEIDRQVVGLVCGTRVAAERLEYESMHTHDPSGRNLCIHSVVVDAPWRRRGLGSRLLTAYLDHVEQSLPGVRQVSLIAKEHLVGFYQAAGFTLLGPSDVTHGRDPWFELARQVRR